MSILIFGKTGCTICGRVINETDSFYSFPSFVINTKDPLYFFSDNSFHVACLNKHVLNGTARKYANLFIEKSQPGNRKCMISGGKIEDYNDYLFIDYLTSNEDEFLHRLNFSSIDKRNLPRWYLRDRVVSELFELNRSGNWKEFGGHNFYIENLINALKAKE
jgi:hypothetical protein